MTLTSQNQPTPGACDGLLFAPVDRWRGVQVRALAQHLEWARHSGLYRGIPLPTELSVENLDAVVRQLPLTTKEQLAAAGRDAWAAPPAQAAEWVCTSGTLGKPLDVPLTRGDLRRLAENESIALSLAGIARGDLVVLGVGMERMFVAGLAYWLGCQELHAGCVRAGPLIAAHPGMLRDMLERCTPAPAGRAAAHGNAPRVFVVAVPSFLRRVEPPAADSPLAGIVAIGEATRGENLQPTATAAELAGRFRCPVMSTYALTETCTTFAESPRCVGGHLNPALAMVEALDDGGEPVAEGTPGEITVTPLGMQGLPLIRFRTGDMAAIFYGACPCGRSTPRVGPILGRRGQLLKIRGTSVYPVAIIEALRSSPSLLDAVVIAEHDGSSGDRVTIRATLRNVAEQDARAGIEGHLRAVLRVVPELRFVSEEELRALQLPPGAGRKATRFIDRRPAHHAV